MRNIRGLFGLGAIALFLVVAALATLAQTAPQATRRLQPAARMEAPVPSSTSVQTLAPGMSRLATSAPIPVFPKNGQAKGHTRTLRSLNGSTIVLSGIANACYPTVGTANTPVTDSTDFQVGCGLTWTSSGLNSGYTSGGTTPNYTDYYLAPGATTATMVGTAGYTGTAGAAHALTGMVAGTYIFGTYDNINQVWDALLYVQIGSIANIDTYLDNQLTDPDGTVAIGNPIYIVASGLTPQHLYVISVENTGSTGQCVYIAPNTAGKTSLTNGPSGKLCNDAVSNTTGTYAAGDNLTFTWTPPNGAVAGYQGGAVSVVPGTYTIAVFDQTANQRVITRQLVISALASSSSAFPTVQAISGPGSLPTTVQTAADTPARIAWNGGAAVPHYDSNVNYMNIGIGGKNLPLTDAVGLPSFLVTLSDPNGKVVYKATATPGSATFAPNTYQSPLPTTTLDFAGEYPTSTWTVGLYQLGHTNGTVTATPAPLGVRSIKVLSYAGAAAWVPTNGGNQATLVLPTTPTNTGYPEQITFTNTGDLDVGPSNADPLKEFVMTFPVGAFTTIGWYTNSGTTPMACPTLLVGNTTGCQQTTIVNTSTGASTGNLDDSNGSPWTAVLTCTDSTKAVGSACGGSTTTYKLTLTPNNAGTGLRPGSYITTPYLFTEELQGSNPCSTTCTATNQLYPLDGFGLSGGTKVINTLGIQFGTLGASNLTSSLYFAGTVVGGSNPTYGELQTLYAPRPGTTSAPATGGFRVTAGHAVMPVGQPYNGPTGGDYLGLDISDQDTGTNDYIQSFAAQFPPNFDVTSATIYEINPGGYYTMTIIPPGTGGCPAGDLCWGAPNAQVINLGGPNCANGSYNNIMSAQAPNICSPAFQTFYIKINQPTKSFSYTDVAISVLYGSLNSAPVISVNKSVPIFVGTPATIDSNAIGSFSLNSTEMLGTLNPTTLGAGVSTNVTFSLENTTTALDPFPDYLDLYTVELPNNSGTPLVAATNGVPTSCATVTVNTANWSCIATQTNTPTGYNTYWFAPTGCSELYGNSSGPAPPTGANVSGSNLVGGTTETANANLTFSAISAACTSILKTQALEPGGQNSVTFPITTSGATPAPAATPVPVYAYAHGANTNAWSNPIVSGLTVANTAQATAGFANAGGYTAGTPAAVSSGQEPTVGSDTDPTNGDSYIYSVKNVGSVNLKQAVITIPYQDTGGGSSASQWAITTGTPPTLTGGNGSCAVAYVNPTASANGSMTIAGAGCIIAANSTVSIRFNAKSPGSVGSTYSWPASVTDVSSNVVAAQETWFTDTLIKITVAAAFQVSVNSSAACTAAAGNAVPTLSVGTNTIDFGAVLASSTDACLDAVSVGVLTNAAKPIGWKVYGQITGNEPATAPPSGLASELSLRTSTSGGSYNPTTDSWINYGAHTYNVASGAGNAGTLIFQSDGSGPSSSTPTTPYTAYIDLQLSLGTEVNASTTNSATVVFTWISS
jgi:hypothetical protein